MSHERSWCTFNVFKALKRNITYIYIVPKVIINLTRHWTTNLHSLKSETAYVGNETRAKIRVWIRYTMILTIKISQNKSTWKPINRTGRNWATMYGQWRTWGWGFRFSVPWCGGEMETTYILMARVLYVIFYISMQRETNMKHWGTHQGVILV